MDRVTAAKLPNKFRNKFINGAGPGLDMLTNNIMRGRDNGLQPYAKYVEQFVVATNKTLNDWNDFRDYFSRQVNAWKKKYFQIKCYFFAFFVEHKQLTKSIRVSVGH